MSLTTVPQEKVSRVGKFSFGQDFMLSEICQTQKEKNLHYLTYTCNLKRVDYREVESREKITWDREVGNIGRCWSKSVELKLKYK